MTSRVFKEIHVGEFVRVGMLTWYIPDRTDRNSQKQSLDEIIGLLDRAQTGWAFCGATARTIERALRTPHEHRTANTLHYIRGGRAIDLMAKFVQAAPATEV